MKCAVCCFGRFNPPTIGHQKLFSVADKLSCQKKADFCIYSTHSEDNHKNPLKYQEKIDVLKKFFPKHEKNFVVSDSKTIYDMLRELSGKGYTDVIIVVGGDRYEDFKKNLKLKPKYQIKLNSLKFFNAGVRNHEAKSPLKSISSSQLRKFVEDDDFNSFKLGLPANVSTGEAKEVFDQIKNTLHINMIEAKENNMDAKELNDKIWERYKKWFYLQETDKKKSKKTKKIRKKCKKEKVVKEVTCEDLQKKLLEFIRG